MLRPCIRNYIYIGVYFLSNTGFINAAESDASTVTPTQLVELYNQAECCIYINQLPSVAFEGRKSLEIDLTKSGKLLQLSTGPSFATLIRLPDSKSDESYTISTQLIQSKKGYHGFFPYAAILDAELNLLGSSTLGHISYEGKEFIFQPTPYLHTTIRIGANAASRKEAKFLLVHTRAKHFTVRTIEELTGKDRNISSDEVSVKFHASNYVLGNTSIYGLPGAVVKISHNWSLF